MKLKGSRAIVTGASQGLGLAIAKGLASHGADLVLFARGSSELASATESLRTQYANRDIRSYTADVTDYRRLEEIIGATIAEGPVDILINNAGVYGPIDKLEDVDLDQWRYAFDVNFYGTLYPLRLLLPHFKKNNYGRVVNLSGGGATKGMPGFTCYSAAKAAVVRLTETVALETADYDITVNAVAPGALNTRLLGEALEAGPEKTGDAFYQASLKQRDAGGSSLENAADLCTFLASRECSRISGRLISAVWDDWKNLASRKELLAKSDVYALRRITARDRGFDWDDRQ